MKTYTLLSGEIIDGSTLSKEEQGYISEIEKLIADHEDYFEIDRRVHAPLVEGRGVLQAKGLIEIYNSPRFKVVADLLERYHQKLYPQKDQK